MITTESELFEATADYIEEHGWMAGRWDDASGAVCLLQGMSNVLREDHRNLFVWDPACTRLANTCGTSPITWNDTTGRTKQEVLDLLRGLAKEARKDEEARA